MNWEEPPLGFSKGVCVDATVLVLIVALLGPDPPESCSECAILVCIHNMLAAASAYPYCSLRVECLLTARVATCKVRQTRLPTKPTLECIAMLTMHKTLSTDQGEVQSSQNTLLRSGMASVALLTGIIPFDAVNIAKRLAGAGYAVHVANAEEVHQALSVADVPHEQVNQLHDLLISLQNFADVNCLSPDQR